jgi:hypothetical protein
MGNDEVARTVRKMKFPFKISSLHYNASPTRAFTVRDLRFTHKAVGKHYYFQIPLVNNGYLYRIIEKRILLFFKVIFGYTKERPTHAVLVGTWPLSRLGAGMSA